MNIIRAFGIEVRRRRLEAGMSVETLAEKAGMSAIQLGKIERGAMASGTGLGIVGKIAAGLGVAPGRLLGPAQGRLLGPAQGFTISAYEAAIWFMKLTDEQQRYVLALIKAIAPRRRS